MPDSLKFNSEIHEIVSIDAKQLFTSINVNRTISHILKVIYKNPSNFFKEKDENNQLLPFPERSDLRKFMHGVLLNFNTFHTQIGTFKQRSGLSMGSPLSSSMSDIFLDLMETTLIDKFIKRRQILHWSRYLSFTVKNMHNDRLKFFDMNIFIGNSKIKFRIFFQKD